MKYFFLLLLTMFLLQACSDNGTSTKECSSDVNCKEWQQCNSSYKCEFKEGMCLEDKDCKDSVKTACTKEHLCVEPIEIADCTAEGNECINNTNGKTICVDSKCTEPIEVVDCTVDGNECANNTNAKTVCIDNKCELPPNVTDCTADGNECANNINGKTVCFDSLCVKPVEVTDCTADGNECADNTNGKTVCLDSLCVVPVEVTDCTADGNECADNTNGKTVCLDSSCVVPVEVTDCTADGNECANNTNGATSCNPDTLKCFVNDCTPTKEVCDGIDNDCNGFIDDNLVVPNADKQFGVCNGSKKVCDGINGWIEPDYSLISEYEVTETKCDDLDNNCDNSTDEGCGGCTEGDKKFCGLDVGACEKGQQVCTNGVWGSCEGGVTPVDEICDGRDNDCDGDIDEDLVAPDATKQDGVCVGSKQVCDGINGWIEPDYTLITGYEDVETQCDDLDNNCDGNIDEGVKLTYYRDADGDGYGDVTDFKTSCTAPDGYVLNKDDCYGDNNPNIYKGAEELCDGLDNDCDGQIDEGYPNTDGDLLPNCLDSDDDNDGDPDELDCAPLDASINHSAGELCDGIDNNCDNTIDEGCNCVAGDTQVCGSDIGICSKGLQTCDINGVWGSCENSVNPATEICDGLDNNCDGTVDEGCGCVQGNTQACGSDVGECQKGTQTCIAGTWGACENQVLPTTELCDGLDNDCDGRVDDNLVAPDANKQFGVCNGSKKVCNGVNGWGEPNYSLIPTYEVVEASCDNLDNDCDNSIDETPIELCTSDASVSVQACVRTPNGNMCKPIVNDVKDTDSGYRHSCSLNSASNQVSCWGTNNYGQLGTGDNISYYSAKTVVGLGGGIKEVVSGSRFSCALMLDTTIRCWGENTYGQLGDDSNSDSNTPVVVQYNWRLGGGDADTFIDIDAGQNHACGVTDSGSVYCWGHNSQGQLGNDSSSDRSSAVQVVDDNGDNLRNIMKVSTGQQHSCALTYGGNVYCWGNNDYGQLGLGAGKVGDRQKKARLVNNIDNAVDLILGANFSCVIDDLNNVKCWGDNSSHQIKYTSTSYYANPTSLNYADALSFKTGAKHLCVRRANGNIECRGSNLYSQVGSDTDIFNLVGTTFGYDIIGGGLGYYHSCVIVDNNYKALMCKGSNFYGQLGLEYTSSSVPNFHFVIDRR